MMRLRRHSGIAALCLLAWTATSSAGDTWVLWRHDYVMQLKSPWTSSFDWTMEGNADTLERCEQLLERAVAEAAAEPGITSVHPRHVVYGWGDSVESREYKCYPYSDTIDPSGAKGE